jgi:hypothetical protein
MHYAGAENRKGIEEIVLKIDHIIIIGAKERTLQVRIF